MNINLINQVFNRLTVIEYYGKNKNGSNLWLCKCICGNEKIVTTSDLQNKRVQSCGCLHKDSIQNSLKKYNEYEIIDNIVKVYLDDDKLTYFICDIQDWLLTKNNKWRFNGRYIETIINGKDILFHRMIMNPTSEEIIDHKDLNTLNNRRDNLRICTSSQNNMNRKLPKNNSSGHKGVWFDNKIQKWRAFIQINKKTKTLGSFDDIESAIKIRELAEKNIYQEFRR